MTGDGGGLLIFDLDGTLVDFSIDWAAVRARLRGMLGVDDALIPMLPAIEALALEDDQRRRVYAYLDRVELGVAERFQRDERLVRLFQGFRRGGWRVALVTLQGRPAAVEALTRLGIADLVDLVVTRDEASARREQIARCMVGLATAPGSTVVVADRDVDMSAGRELGTRTIAVGGRPGVAGDSTVRSVLDVGAVLGIEDAGATRAAG